MKTNMFELSKFVKWSVCGDGYVGYATNNRNAHYSIQRDPIHKDYIEVIANKFVGLQDCNVRISETIRRDNNKRVVGLYTSSHPLFTRIRDRQYIHNHRVIDPHMLTMLDWEAAAFLYQDDGSNCVTTSGSRIIRISTCAYSYPEQEVLRKAFIEKLGIIANINRCGKYWQLNIPKRDQQKFLDNVSPYIVPSYEYKLT